MTPLNDVITLVTEGPGERNENGFRDDVVLKQQEIFAAVESAKRSEYYEAIRSGMHVSATFTINKDDYDECIVILDNKRYKPNKIIYEDIEYVLQRTYRKGSQYIELIVAEVE